MNINYPERILSTNCGHQRYHGEILNDLPHGRGTIFYPNGVLQYSGYFFEGKYHGWGNLFYNQATDTHPLLKYTGEFYKGKAQGFGHFYTSDRYFDESQNTFLHKWEGVCLAWIGHFSENHPHGHGRQYNEFAELIYEGRMDTGLYHGKGKLYENGKLKYVGNWRNNKKNGQGIEYTDGIQTFQGRWKNDEKDLSNEINRNNLALYLETADVTRVKNIPLRFLRKYLKETYQEENKQWRRKDVIEMIQKKHRHTKQSNQTSNVHDLIETDDIFGNEIVIACFGDDGGVYDLKSMLYMFEKNEEGDYTNIPYEYDENNQRIPSFRRVHAAKQLTSYSCPALSEWDMN